MIKRTWIKIALKFIIAGSIIYALRIGFKLSWQLDSLGSFLCATVYSIVALLGLLHLIGEDDEDISNNP
jgi:hypothetical protein